MTRKKTEHLTRLELEVMHVLWETGPAQRPDRAAETQARAGIHNRADHAQHPASQG